MQQARTRNSFAQRKAAGSKNDDRPEEVVEVFLSKDARAEEQDERDDGHDAHVSEYRLQTVRDAPEGNSDKGDNDDEPLRACVRLLYRPDGYDDCAPAGSEEEHKE